MSASPSSYTGSAQTELQRKSDSKKALMGFTEAYCCVEGAGLANDHSEDLAIVASASGEVAKGALHLGEESHPGGAAEQCIRASSICDQCCALPHIPA